MRKLLMLVPIGVVVASVGLFTMATAQVGSFALSDSDDNDSFLTFEAELSGDQEVPPVDTDTTGGFRIDFNDDLTAASYRLEVRDGVRISQAHIHCAPAGTNGPVVVFLAGFIAEGLDVDGRWIDNVTITDANIINDACGATLAELAMAMLAGDTYVNVHSVAHPGGEVRGQLGLDDDDDDDGDDDDSDDDDD